MSLLLFDSALFRTGLYARIVEPDSTTGAFELTLGREQRRRLSAEKEVLVLGDSRMGEGFSAKLATQIAGPGWHFSSAAVAGMSQRCWWYMIRDLDPAATRYQVVVLPMDDYSDIDSAEDVANREADLRWLINRLRWTDILEFANSFPDEATRARIFQGSILKGTVYQRDIVQYLEHTHARAMKVHFWRDVFWPNLEQYTGHPGSLAGMQVDWEHGTVIFPPGITPAVQESVKNSLFAPIPPQTGRVRRYRERWLGKILDHYRFSGTHFVFFRIPGTPASAPRFPIPDNAFINQVQSRPNVQVLDEHAFDHLQRPENFFDGIHMNAKGRREFSAELARQVAAPGHAL